MLYLKHFFYSDKKKKKKNCQRIENKKHRTMLFILFPIRISQLDFTILFKHTFCLVSDNNNNNNKRTPQE